MLLGHQSRREVLRSRFRTAAAMRAQVRDQGRHQGGRPPYGYRLVDAGPHPNAAHARWDRQSPLLRDRIPTRPAPTCLPGSYAAAYADAYSTRTGCIAGPGTAAGTATPAPAEKTLTGP